jgi:hypothetical protein
LKKVVPIETASSAQRGPQLKPLPIGDPYDP